jgi:hypothetical protein
LPDRQERRTTTNEGRSQIGAQTELVSNPYSLFGWGYENAALLLALQSSHPGRSVQAKAKRTKDCDEPRRSNFCQPKADAHQREDKG